VDKIVATDTWSANAVAAVKKNIEQAEEINFAIQVVAPNRQEFGQLTVLTNNTRVNLMESLVGSEMAMQQPSVMDELSMGLRTTTYSRFQDNNRRIEPTNLNQYKEKR
jgi:hypothetical protein